MTPPIHWEETTLTVPGLPRPLTLMQITDAHMTLSDQRDSAYTREVEEDRTGGFGRVGMNLPPAEAFRLTLKAAEGADCLVFTGDILDAPTAINRETLDGFLNPPKTPYLYITGNHDWSRTWINGRSAREDGDLEVLGAFLDPRTGYGVCQLDGVRLIGLDDSEYQISEDALRFFREQTADGAPCLLFLHIPLYLPTLLADTMDAWEDPILLGAPPELYRQRTAPVPTESTLEFCRLAETLPNLLGVFTGHLHFPHEDLLSSGVRQYVTPPAYQGRGRRIRLVPGE